MASRPADPDGRHPRQEEQERRATSSLLAVMRAVPEFGHALLKELGAPKSPVIETFAEVRFKDAAGKTVIPDGAIVCRARAEGVDVPGRGQDRPAPRCGRAGQRYLDIARENGFDGVLTISNQITAASTESPVSVDGRKLEAHGLWHLSWWRILTEAIVQHRYRGISDPDQAWILGELIAYLDNEASGAGGFEDMGDKWVTVRKAAHDGTLRARTTRRCASVAERWEQFTQYLCLGPLPGPRPRRPRAAAAQADDRRAPRRVTSSSSPRRAASAPCSAFPTRSATYGSGPTCARGAR